ncbi:helix-turn-helix domain-containing protein [Mycobacterium sp. IDR2000157661]|uniref:helix-turn-helix domain-containing protein n=1 Tax=Mycobacterium sp. IDR2000157661 TaxID=2867005 RepID=UPI001EEC359E|nr:helix-turn-helix transcriptional regulator [Mycobacterium sp. IDR2000157661]ULE34353.1 helix-turn-helix transcriptional regulator [Mycobacterium sp. IDR2000157661]
MAGRAVDAARAFERQAWAEVYECLADASDSLDADYLERLAVASYLLGEDDESARAWERAYAAFLTHDLPDRAAECGFWLGLTQLLAGNAARGGGWLARVGRLVDDAGVDCAARGYLLVAAGLAAWTREEPSAALELFGQAAEIAARFGDNDLAALAWLGQGQASVTNGQTARGLALLDEAMVSVTAGEVSPIPAGIVYCGVIETCMGVFDLSRATEWTRALSDWCDAQPDLVPYRGQCLVHRSQILQLHGEWARATAAARKACDHLSRKVHPALGMAAYQLGELHRLCGAFDDAETAYRRAHRQGREPLPGLALLHLAEGHVDAAAAGVRRAVRACPDRFGRPAALAAHAEVMLAVGEVSAARMSADELSVIAESGDAPFLHAIAAHTEGATLLAEGAPDPALDALHRAAAGWSGLAMPYEAARTGVEIGLACRALGDHVSAMLEFDAAREIFGRLGAEPDLRRLVRLGEPGPARAGRLTGRECEVLRLVAAGNSNREIGARLVLSEHTVARHLQNIYAKLDLSSRAAATAYAYEHHLV